MPFVKGKSGNPGGRPKVDDEVKTLAKAHGKEAMERLITLMRANDDKKLAMQASCAILDRGYGKPVQTLANDTEHPFNVDRFSSSDSELMAKLREAAESGRIERAN